jgi:FixJ family two-component response regulator
MRSARSEESAPPPTVFVVDDDPGIRDSLAWLLQSVRLPIETFASADEFLAAFSPARPGCLVLDVRLPGGMGGLDLLDELRQRGSTLPVIVVTAFGEVHSAVRAMKSGAIDVMEKPARDQVLLDRIQQALEQDRRTREEQAARRAWKLRYARLTPRERQVLKAIAAGKPNKVIAAELELSAKTVESHRAAILRKLDVRSTAELVRIELLTEDD